MGGGGEGVREEGAGGEGVRGRGEGERDGVEEE